MTLGNEASHDNLSDSSPTPTFFTNNVSYFLCDSDVCPSLRRDFSDAFYWFLMSEDIC